MSIMMLLRDNPYQQSVYLTSANSVSATVYEGMSSVTGYVALKDINEDLQERNALLEMELIKLRNEINEYKMQLPDSGMHQPIHHLPHQTPNNFCTQ